ncbi:MAG: CBS domain-containing protein [Candidatus Eisenbacteria bacterium]|uniref:CBS domain-containing protein n=1 Tax=Eiseniibacteriota bacterium TaxID=2212470 RepID=A0A538TVD0_UNCEI|nr:MAG: CBS domain-containing protein [Candidatus Eisenbacteria bacterium]
MASVRDILARKGAACVSISPEATVAEAARLMNERGIGGVLVLERERLVGIFTERDVLRRVIAERLDPATTVVLEVMTTPVVTCLPETSLEELGAILSTRRIRHLPVVGAEGLCGVVTSGDLLAYQVADQAATIQYLNNYMFDRR